MSQKLEKKKLEFIETRVGKLKKKVIGLEKKLFRALLTKFIVDLQTENGVISNTPKNLALISVIDEIYNDFNNKHQSKLTSQYASDLIKIGGFNQEYFKSIVQENKEEINEKLKARNLRTLGIEKVKGKTKIKKDGYLDLFLKDTTVKTQIKRRALLAVQVGMSVQDLRKTIATDVVTSQQSEGLLKRYWRQNAIDTYSAFDRSTSKALADEYEMQACAYSNGTESDTRKFCKHNVGKIYLRDEVEEWKDYANRKRGKKYIGPIVESKSSYNPFIQQGGINCKHSLRWITNRTALREDKTLTEENGVLIRQEGKNPNKTL